MTDHCINFLPYQVRAALDGRLSQTRRVLKYDKCGAPIMPAVEGDRLWVREAHAFDGPLVRYYATDDVHELRKKRSPIHMPRWASRLTLVVTDVRVQRVQEISEDDAEAEGVEKFGIATWRDYQSDGVSHVVLNCRNSFRTLWNSIHGEDAWDRDDWVSAISFTVHRCNIDQREDAG